MPRDRSIPRESRIGRRPPLKRRTSSSGSSPFSVPAARTRKSNKRDGGPCQASRPCINVGRSGLHAPWIVTHATHANFPARGNPVEIPAIFRISIGIQGYQGVVVFLRSPSRFIDHRVDRVHEYTFAYATEGAQEYIAKRGSSVSSRKRNTSCTYNNEMEWTSRLR